MIRCTAMVSVLAGLAACASTAPQPDATVPPRPAVPDLWRTITNEQGEVTLVVPPELVVTNVDGAISGFREPDGEVEELIVTATGPSRVEQRAPAESVADWVTRTNLLTAGRGEPESVTRREVMLPSGAALEMTSAFPFDNEGRWTMLHIIDTGQGYAILQFDGGGPPPDEPSDEVRLMRELVEFRP